MQKPMQKPIEKKDIRPFFAQKDPLEADIEKGVCEWARGNGILCYKFSSPGHRSVPDRMFILPDGEVLFIEFKREGKQPSAAQAKEIAKLLRWKQKVFVVDNIEAGKTILGSENV